MPGLLAFLGLRKEPTVTIPSVPVLTAKRATELYGTPDGDPKGEWARENIVYCGGGGHPSCLPAMPGVPPRLWFAIHRRAEPKLREAFRRALVASDHKIGSAGGWVYRHQRHDERRPLSNHSWGAAVDVDAAKNGGKTFPGGKGSPAPYSAAWRKLWPKGLPQAWVEAFLSVGGIGWGGMWPSFRDLMHFEVYDPEG